MPLSAQSVSATLLRKTALDMLRVAGTDAGAKVYDADFNPDAAGELPEVYLSTPSIRRDIAGKGNPKFLATIALVAVVRVTDTNDQATEQKLNRLAEQVESAVLSSPAVNDLVQEFSYVETHGIVTVAGERPIGEASIIFGCQVWQEYWPDAGTPLTGFHTTVPASAQGAPTTFDTPRPPSP